jgi:hypothetical protein
MTPATVICVDREGKQLGETHIQREDAIRPLCGKGTRGAWQSALAGTEPSCKACKQIANYIAPGDQVSLMLV